MQRNRLSVIFTLFMLLSQLVLGASTGKIAGTVTDAETGEVLVGVNLVLVSQGIGAASDLEGHFTILNVRPGTHVLRASIIGYQQVEITGIDVVIGLTSDINVTMSTEVLGGETVTVVSQRPLVKKDLSGSQMNMDAGSIEPLPVSSVSEVLGMNAGMDAFEIRGGSRYQTAVIMDGFVMTDNRSSAPVTTISLSSVEEIQVQMGGYNAEYGNIRSGIVNVITAEGRSDGYHGSVYYQNSPAAPKHFGMSPYDPNSYFMRPYLDDDVAWEGTSNGAWDLYTRSQYPNFVGWNTYYDPETGVTAAGAQREWMFRHRRTGEITKPDQTLDLGIGGPLPVFSDVRFYLSHRSEEEMFLVPLSRDSYTAHVTRLKLNYDISGQQKLMASVLRSAEHSINPYNWTTVPEGDLTRGTYSVANLVSSAVLFTPDYFTPYSVYRTHYNLSYNHMLSNSSYYELILQHAQTRYRTYEPDPRDTTLVEIFTGYEVTEAPYGYDASEWMSIGRDTSRSSETVLKGDYTNQINTRNQVKTGFQLTLQDMQVRSYMESNKDTWSRAMNYDVSPYRFSVYLQDKVEFEGFIANLGLRGELSQSNTNVYILDPYDELFKQGLGALLEELAETEPAKPSFTLSPRLGISHPITDVSKLYFNYGHFYSEARSTYRFRLQRESNGLVTDIGNPELNQEKTVSYELGFSQGIGQSYLLDIAAYYKDITNQPGWVVYRSANGTVNYQKAESNNYQDIRGIEFTLNKRAGRFLSGFINYTYMVKTSGYFGLLEYYQDPQAQREYELSTIFDSKPRPQPFARGALTFAPPNNTLPFGLGDGLTASLFGEYKYGSTITVTEQNQPYYIKWKSQYLFDARVSKEFDLQSRTLEVFCDVDNVFNTKYLSSTGFSDVYDYQDYLSSLRMPFKEGIEKGEDEVGTYREWDVEYDPLVANPDNDPEIAAANERRIETRSYIDMPDIQSLTFLNPRKFTLGIKVKF